ncbi:serine-threonine protein kinase 19-domain-containing protein [Fimicolochytrium jonesii]|uniref:serine-threonine protein kinase 19-domain-containing protein n=1 Tax=Fimicolochytrium jonesii TaxID=1396493 RepID=UPI0022FE3CD2|nr:serine-threonine protein kinase 19-domain-containing protein [Fimicolochytrium jonesii]KAI8818913.1 serine-threonine protein kinase 19-domain-containing protein [Fimicolochytrium jonesii]
MNPPLPFKSKKRTRCDTPTWSALANPAIADLLIAESSTSLPHTRDAPPAHIGLRRTVSAPPALIEPTRRDTAKTVLQALVEIRGWVPVNVPPLVLVSQVYASVGDKDVDRDIAQLCRVGTLRKFQVGTGGETCLMLMCDYADIIKDLSGQHKRRFRDGGGGTTRDCGDGTSEESPSPSKRPNTGATPPPPPSTSRTPGATPPPPQPQSTTPSPSDSANSTIRPTLFDLFLSHLSMPSTPLFLTTASLTTSLSCTPAELRLLFSSGLLTLKDVDTYWVSVPNAGRYWADLCRGRKELCRVIGRAGAGKGQKAGVRRSEVEKRELRGCGLPVRAVVGDLVGRGVLESIETPLGTHLRLTGKTSKDNFQWS